MGATGGPMENEGSGDEGTLAGSFCTHTRGVS